MLTEAHQDFLIELRGSDGGLSLLPSHRLSPKKHRFQGGLIYSSMIEIEGRVLAPHAFGGHGMRIWLAQLQEWHFSRHQPVYVGAVCDRTGELPGGGLEAALYIPKDAWLPAVNCLAAHWRRLSMRGVDGDGRRMTLVDFSFSSGA